MVITRTRQINFLRLLTLRDAKCRRLNTKYDYYISERLIHHSLLFLIHLLLRCRRIAMTIHNFPVSFSSLAEAATLFPFAHTLNPFPFLYFVPVLSQMIVMIFP